MTKKEKARVRLSLAGFAVMLVGVERLHWPLAGWIGGAMVVGSALWGVSMVMKYAHGGDGDWR